MSQPGTGKADRQEILDVLREYRRETADQFGIEAIGLFGSVARNEADDKSDVDVVVRVARPNLVILSHIRADLEARLNRHVDVVRWRDTMNPALQRRIERDAIYA